MTRKISEAIRVDSSNPVHTNWLSQYAGVADELRVFDTDGKDVTAEGVIKVGYRVEGPWVFAIKNQPVYRIGTVTQAMCTDKAAADNDGGVPVGEDCLIIGYNPYWTPVLQAGHLLIRDRSNPRDTWGVKGEDDFERVGYSFVEWDESGPAPVPVYGKPGKHDIVMQIPDGFKVLSEEGEHTATDGSLLKVSKGSDRGDHQIWSPDVVTKLVNYPDAPTE